MQTIKIYWENLQRYEKANKWFKSLDDSKLMNIERTKAYQEYNKIVNILNKLYPIVRDKGFDFTQTNEVNKEVMRKWNLI